MAQLDPAFMMSMVKGRFADTSRNDLASMFTRFRASSRPLVIYFHGGLVSRDAGIANAMDLNNRFSGAADCMFPIWETGIWEVLQRNWPQIASDTIFDVVRDRVMGAVFQKAKEVAGIRGLTLDYQPGLFTNDALAASAAGSGDVAVAPDNPDFSKISLLSETQEEGLAADLQTDEELAAAFQSAINAHVGTAPVVLRSAFSSPKVAPRKSRVDRRVLNAIVRENKDARAIPVAAAMRVLGIIKNVILRFIQRKDHGLHATVTEEILRALYFSAVGTSFWKQIKDYTHLTFQNGSDWCGTALLDEIGKLASDKPVYLVGHSAGAVFISELLTAAGARGMKRTFDVIFLAPAARADLFEEALAASSGLIRNFRMYTMSDATESADILIRTDNQGGGVGWFYPRSLLYFISGILEKEVDSPLVGMQRYYGNDVWCSKHTDVEAMQNYIAGGANRACWSVTANPNPRLCANATSHSDFAHSVMLKGVQNSTIAGIVDILQTGAF